MHRWLAHLILAFAMVSWPFPGPSLADGDGVPIVKLALRDHLVTISSAAQGLRYSVLTPSGELLSENLTEQELLAAHPQIFERIRSGYADGGSGSFIWAGSDESMTEPSEESSIGDD